MARIARSENGIARASIMDALEIKAATGGTLKDAQRIMLAPKNANAMACTTRSAWGGQRIAHAFDAMVEAQGNRCLFCTRVFYSAPENVTPIMAGTVPTIFLLIPSAMWADVEVTGIDAHQSGYVAGNMVAACTMCSDDRERAQIALGYTLVVTADSLDPRQCERVLLSLPTGRRATALDESIPSVSKGRAVRVASVGW